MSDKPEDLLNCGVCLEEYQDSGCHVPRLLPCTHTLCEKCLIELLGQQGRAKLTCPECRTHHVHPKKQRTFPQNKYLLSFIKWRNTAQSKKSEEESNEKVSWCPDHGKELTLFCKETQCQTLICSGCLTIHHLKHEVNDADERWKEELLQNLASAIQSLSFKKEQIAMVQKKHEKCVRKLAEEKKSILNLVRDKFDSLITQATNQTEEHKSKMTSLEENLVLLNNIKQYISSKTPSPREVKNCHETVDSVTEHNDKAPMELCYMEYTENKDKERLVEELCGEMVHRNHTKDLPYKQSESTGDMSGTLVKPFQQMEKNIIVASRPAEQLERIGGCQGWLQKTWQTEDLTNLPSLHFLPRYELDETFETLVASHLYLSAEGRNSVFVYYSRSDDVDSDRWNLAHYNLVTAEERCRVTVDDCLSGMKTIVYDNQTCIALSYRKRNKLEFRPEENLKQVVYSLDVGPFVPGRLCAVTSSPSELLCSDYNTGKIHRVDCITAPPTLQGEIPNVYNGEERVRDMCTSHDLLLVTRYREGVFCYTLPGGELKWKVSGNLPKMEWDIGAAEVTADEQGRLFISDHFNDRVHALSVQDGTHLGVVVTRGEDGIEIHEKVAWLQDCASLIVADRRNGGYYLSIFSRQDLPDLSD